MSGPGPSEVGEAEVLSAAPGPARGGGVAREECKKRPRSWARPRGRPVEGRGEEDL